MNSGYFCTGQTPIPPLRRTNGEWLRLEVALPAYSAWRRAWQVQMGRETLDLLESDDPVDHPIHSGITSGLYDGGPELRLQQEMMPRLGGWRLLRAVKPYPEVCHLNEGRAVFPVLGCACCFREDNDSSFDVALGVTRTGSWFKTHMTLMEGFERLEPGLISQDLRNHAVKKLGVPLQDFLALERPWPMEFGRGHP